MDSTNKDIQTLSIAKVLGTLTAEDEKLLAKAVENDPEARAIYERVVSEMNDPKNIELSNNWDSGETIRLVKERVRRKKVRLYTAVATAASLLLFGGIYFLGDHNRSLTVAKVSDDIVFTGNDGKKIKIDSSFRQAVVGNVTITATGNVLHYSVTGAGIGQTSSLSVPVGKDYSLELSDHSIVHLNASSTITFPVNFSDAPNSRREITIDGEAFLDVAHDATRPFVVHLPKGDVQVLGTRFNVNSYVSDNTQVSLVSGSVRMTSGKEAVLLTPGTQAVATTSGLSKRPFDSAAVLAWQEGKYVFQDAALTEVGQVLKRYYGLQMDMSALKVSDYLYTGVLFKNEPVSQFLYELSEALHVRAQMQGNNVLLTK